VRRENISSSETQGATHLPRMNPSAGVRSTILLTACVLGPAVISPIGAIEPSQQTTAGRTTRKHKLGDKAIEAKSGRLP